GSENPVSASQRCAAFSACAKAGALAPAIKAAVAAAIKPGIRIRFTDIPSLLRFLCNHHALGPGSQMGYDMAPFGQPVGQYGAVALLPCPLVAEQSRRP